MINITGGLNNVLIRWTEGLTLESLVAGRITTAINFFFYFSALVAVTFVIASGYMFITSSGDPEKIEKAQKALTAAIVGMIIVFLARVIIGFVMGFITP